MPCTPAPADTAIAAKPTVAAATTSMPATTPRTSRAALMSRPLRLAPKGPAHASARGGPAHGPSAKARQAVGDVGEPGVLATDPIEQRPGAGRVAGPLLEVGQGVPEPQVVRVGLGNLLVGAGEERDGLVHAAAVGERTGRHDPSLGDDVGSRRGGGQLTPARIDL